VEIKFLIDSDILIDVLKGVNGSKEFLFDLWGKGVLYTTLINIAEILSGKETKDKRTKEKIMDFLNEFVILGFDFGGAVKAGEIRRDYNIPFADAVIASIAVSTECQLVTYNEKHFKDIENLKMLIPKYRAILP
jgi:predicted nucleic acid-binding protein